MLFRSASRMLAMALLVGMLAQWLTDSKMFAWMGQTTVHHYIVLDDSASMGDTANSKSAYQNALGAIASIAAATKQDSQNHLISIFRASRVQQASAGNKTEQGERETANSATVANSASNVRADSVADLLAQSIPSDPSTLLAKINSTQPTALEVGVLGCLDVVSKLIQASSDQRSKVVILSDFRSKDWSNPVAIRQRLQGLQTESVEVDLVDCVDSRHENLTVVSVEPRQEVLAAGVPTLVNVTVRNQGLSPVRNLSARVTAVDYSSKAGEPKGSEPFSGTLTEQIGRAHV